MAARSTKLELTERWKEKIKASMLLNRLMEHILSDDGILNASQVRAAEILLKKVMPDLAHTTGEVQHSFVDDLTERLAMAKEKSDASRLNS
jgi:hypothetical protein